MLFLLPSALCMDLDLRIAAPDADPVSLTLHDISIGVQPAFVIAREQGGYYRVQVDVEPDQDAWTLAFQVESQTITGRNHLTTRAVSAPVLRVLPDQDAMVSQGVRAPDGTEKSAWTLTVMVRTEP